MAKVRPPSTIDEYRRIAHALLVGSKLKSGSKAYVVMSTIAPLYRVQGIYRTEAEAQAAAAQTAKLPGFAWTPTEKESRAIIECRVPDMTSSNEIAMIVEGPSTESYELDGDDDYTSESWWTFENITKMEFRMTVNGHVVTYEMPSDSTALFITQGAAETFLQSQYYAYFGAKYAGARALRMKKGGKK